MGKCFVISRKFCIFAFALQGMKITIAIKRMLGLLTALLMLAVAYGQQTESRCPLLQGVPLEGPLDSVRTQLQAADWTEWGQSDDGEDYYFRGKFYGIRAKLLVSINASNKLLTSAYVSVGPYSTKAMLERNLQYFLYKLKQEHGDFVERDGSWVYMDDFASVKVSLVDNGSGSRDIRVFYLPMGAYYKDAICMGLHGPVQEVVTENAVSEDQFMRFSEDGQWEHPDLTKRQYDRYGYLRQAEMTEVEGHSNVSYEYDSHYRLVRRTLTNEADSIRYIHEYTYNERDEVASQSQKVFKNDECVLTLNMRNNYLTRDDQGNWTTNSLSLSYWEKGSQSQQTTVLQKRTIAYWEE